MITDYGQSADVATGINRLPLCGSVRTFPACLIIPSPSTRPLGEQGRVVGARWSAPPGSGALCVIIGRLAHGL